MATVFIKTTIGSGNCWTKNLIKRIERYMVGDNVEEKLGSKNLIKRIESYKIIDFAIWNFGRIS
jgi:recombination DNA repair RAD52 pathway protein